MEASEMLNVAETQGKRRSPQLPIALVLSLCFAFILHPPRIVMSQSPPPVAGPSNHGNNSSNTDPSLLRQFVREYLQQHGFDKALAMFDQGMVEGSGGGEDKDADGEEEVVARRGSASGGVSGREAIFRAPGPVALDNAVKRNIPQAQFVSASTMSDRITPEFESQAKYIIDQLTQKAEAQADTTQKGGEEPLLDPSDRIEGYKRYRRWVDDGLDIWKVSYRRCYQEADRSLNWMLCASRYLRTPSLT